ncbi:defective proboscis extension response 20 [Haematobia irritans]|uniref:defective proboscis extension response 20 n=1 Tax=Haematobia irritans TaxID=7368 RepID=UPI003F50AC19
MWLKFKNVATFVIETFHLLLLTLILGHTFHVKQFDEILVMAASTIGTIRTTTTPLESALSTTALHASYHHPSQAPFLPSTNAVGVSGNGDATSLLPLSTMPLPSQSSSTVAFASLWETTVAKTSSNASRLLNFTPNTGSESIVDSNEIDTMDSNDADDGEDNENGFLDMDYVMTKHIASMSDESTGDFVASGTATVPMTSKSSTSPRLPKSTASLLASSPRATLVTPPMSSTMAHHRNNPAAMTTFTTATMDDAAGLAALSASASLLNHRFNANRTRLDDLSSLSLLSLNDTSSSESHQQLATSSMSLMSSLIADASSTPTISSQATTRTLPTHHTATSLRIRGDEKNMRSTKSHLTVDNVNATLVASDSNRNVGNSSGGSLSASSSSHYHHGHHHQHSHSHDVVNSSSSSSSASTAAGRNNSSIVASSGGSDNSFGSDAFMSASGNIGGQGAKMNGTGTTRISARKVEHKHLLPKLHKTDAPMLNYIFDTFSSANKHHHHDQRYGPHFEDVQLVGKPTNMTVQAGSSIHLNCRISLLQDKTVSWVRRNPGGENALDLLTVGLHTYTGDKRYKMEFQYPNNWRLKIANVKKDDEATYECQISTHPPRVIQINLHVNAPKVMIVDEFGDPLQEKYYEQDSTLQLSCVVRNVAMSTSVVFWKHSEDVLNYDVTRGGISVKTELMEDGANSTLFIAKINKADSGNYTCSISEYQNYTIIVHILNGESFAELHHGNAICRQCPNHQTWAINLIVLVTILLLLPAYDNR